MSVGESNLPCIEHSLPQYLLLEQDSYPRFPKGFSSHSLAFLILFVSSLILGGFPLSPP